MTARDYLAAVQQRADAATDGPWEHRLRTRSVIRTTGFATPFGVVDGAVGVTSGVSDDADAEFIAASRTDVPRLVAALTAALDLADEYERDDREHLDRFGQHHPVAYHPYPHIRAVITDALTPKENDS